ncbi:MAG: chemotaxis protein CheW [Burkholderiaceae bacterium]|jgi:twitching motility protein PilI|nr:chemotaxis protein CheW [Burkholderiaceae bacterium]
MAKREALREFQSRLAQRFLSAQTAGVAAAWLAVESGRQALLFPLSHAGEIFSWAGVRRVPYVKPWFLGAANLRGDLFGVIDLAHFLHVDRASGASAKPPGPRTDSDLAQCRLVILNPVLEAGCALLIDRLLGLRMSESFTRSDAPLTGSPGYYGHVYTDTQGRRWQEINLQRLAQTPAFLDISV